MWAVAFGIILAVVILASWRLIVAAGALVIVGLIALSALLLFIFNADVRNFSLVAAGLVGGLWLLRKMLHAVGVWVRARGGWLRVLEDGLFALRPAFTEKQRVRKQAALIRHHDAVLARSAAKQRRAEAKQRRSAARAELARHQAVQREEARVARARAELAREVHKLERRFADYGLFTFDYGDEHIDVRSASARDGRPILTLSYDPVPRVARYRLEDRQAATPAAYEFLGQVLAAARKVLRRHAAEHLARGVRQLA